MRAWPFLSRVHGLIAAPTTPQHPSRAAPTNHHFLEGRRRACLPVRNAPLFTTSSKKCRATTTAVESHKPPNVSPPSPLLALKCLRLSRSRRRKAVDRLVTAPGVTAAATVFSKTALNVPSVPPISPIGFAQYPPAQFPRKSPPVPLTLRVLGQGLNRARNFAGARASPTNPSVHGAHTAIGA